MEDIWSMWTEARGERTMGKVRMSSLDERAAEFDLANPPSYILYLLFPTNVTAVMPPFGKQNSLEA